MIVRTFWHPHWYPNINWENNKPASFWARSNNECNHLGRPPRFPDSVCILKWKSKLHYWINWKIPPELCDCSTDFSPYLLAYTSFAAAAYNIQSMITARLLRLHRLCHIQFPLWSWITFLVRQNHSQTQTYRNQIFLTWYIDRWGCLH